MDSDGSDLETGLFDEPEGFGLEETGAVEHATVTWERCLDRVAAEPPSLSLRLAKRHSLWGHTLWNAGKVFANMFDRDPALVAGKRVVEFGAGAALPALTCALNGAKKVVITDYPDKPLLDNIRENVRRNPLCDSGGNVVEVVGHLWGSDPRPVLSANDGQPFDIVIMSDLVFNHAVHDAMLKSAVALLSPTGHVLVAFSHHRPLKAAEDMDFLTKAAGTFGFTVEALAPVMMPPMFPDDPGDVNVRSTVKRFRLVRHAQSR